MKCIHCGTETRRRDRRGGACPRCRHRFAFEPGEGPYSLGDPRFKAAVDRASGGGRVFFTERHLWYRLNAARPRAGLFARKIPFELFRAELLPRWTKVHGPIAGLVPPREAAPAPREVPPDVAAFSFDRAVVTDLWETAAMLVANRFHFEHACAVLSADGYPDGIAETVKTMLRRNPALTVFALHDASPEGCVLPLTLREPEWFPDAVVRVVDLGIKPEIARRLRLPEHRPPLRPFPPRLKGIVSADDLHWLSRGLVGELAALPPAAVLRAAWRGIVRAGHPREAPREKERDDPRERWEFWYAGSGGGGDAGGDTASVDGFG